ECLSRFRPERLDIGVGEQPLAVVVDRRERDETCLSTGELRSEDVAPLVDQGLLVAVPLVAREGLHADLAAPLRHVDQFEVGVVRAEDLILRERRHGYEEARNTGPVVWKMMSIVSAS